MPTRRTHKAGAVAKQIQALVDLETKAWDTKDPDLLLSIIHPDMVWAWPPGPDAHDPADWVMVLGRFDRRRWRKNWQELFDNHELVRNRRVTVKIVVSAEQDAAFAVLDVDTLWRHKRTRRDFHWLGRACKLYTKLPSGAWKFYCQTGLLDYSSKARAGARARVRRPRAG